MNSPGLAIERSGAWHRVRLDDPERRNTLTPQVIDGLGSALSDCESDPGARALILEGSGGIFCDGMDLGAAALRPQVRGAGGEAFAQLLSRFTRSPRVIVSVVDGRAVGGGVGLVAASDYVIATPTSTFALPEAIWGLVPYLVGPFVVRRCGAALFRRMALSTLPLDAAQAHVRGLVDVVDEDPRRRLQLLLGRLRRIQEPGISRTKQYCDSFAEADDEVIDRAMGWLEDLLTAPGMSERLSMFAEVHASTGPSRDL